MSRSRHVLPALMLAVTMIAPVQSLLADDDSALFQALLDEHMQWYLQEHPQQRSRMGDLAQGGRWDDESLAAHARRDAVRAGFLERLADISPDALGEQGALSHAMLTRRLSDHRERHRLGLYLMRLNMREGPQHAYDEAEYLPFAAPADYDRWLARLEGIPKMLAQHRALLEEGIARRRVQAREVMQRVPDQIRRVTPADPVDSPFYRPFQEMPESMPAEQAQLLAKRAAELIAQRVTPAYREFGEFLSNTYLPATRPEPGVGSLPGGPEIYRFLARYYTTTDMTPQAIHETGLREVARILAEMEAVRSEVAFDGDLAAFNDFLRSDPQFYYDTPEALLEGYRSVAKRLDPELVKLFGRLPRMPYGVRPIPAESAPDTTTAYYMQPAQDGSRAGYYYVNLYRPEVRPRYEMEVLSVHEAVPGHHLQIALAQELEGLPAFRRFSSVTAFVEGWALYSERLGYQMGLYRDPYSRYGQLTYDMWRAVRLVVDTGIHYMGWSRERAIDYFQRHAGKTETDIVNEVDRYIGWPGQALAYKIGQLKILELRALAEQRLGEQFDIRDFHDHLLGAGAIPLDALEARMRTWIASREAMASAQVLR